MAAKRPRVPLNPAQPGLNAAFGSLDLQNLPAGPEKPPPGSSSPAASRAGRVVLRREKSGRGGKTVIVIDDFAPHHTAPALEALAGRLRAACGCGGTLKGRAIEIQGDQPARIRTLLEQEGFRVAGVS